MSNLSLEIEKSPSIFQTSLQGEGKRGGGGFRSHGMKVKNFPKDPNPKKTETKK